MSCSWRSSAGIPAALVVLGVRDAMAREATARLGSLRGRILAG